MGTMEDVIRRIVREEISRAFTAAEQVADGADMPYETGEIESTALTAISKVMERVARDVLADKHPVLDTEHASTDNHRCPDCNRVERFGHWHSCPRNEHTASTETVHTITAVPERSRAACTCVRHRHVLGLRGHRCRAAGCYCLSPERARPEHTSTEAPRVCSVCEHGEHDQGECTMHVYLRGVASPCPCLASRTLGAQPSTPPNPMCTVCEHAPHGGYCGHPVTVGGRPFTCACGGRS